MASGFGGMEHERKRPLDERVKIAAWTLHDLRRTVATRMADLGVATTRHRGVAQPRQSGHKAGVAGIYNRSSYERAKYRAAFGIVGRSHPQPYHAGGERKIIPLRP